MRIDNAKQTVIEKVAIAITAITYLTVFYRTLPHSDALRIVRQIEQAHLIWNPNHLLFDPLGYVVYALISWLGLEITMLGSFSIISGTATVLSLLIFHSILMRLGIKLPSVRLVGTACVWASHAFLSQSVSQYYFMVQMPFLLGALYLYFDFIIRLQAGQVSHRNIYSMGLLLALSATIMFNNLLLVLAAGAGVGLVGKSWRTWQMGFPLRLWGAAAALGVPVFIVGYLFSGQESGFFTWLLSYGGDSASKLNEFYGIKWTPSGVIDAAAMVVFNTILGGLLSTAGLGTILRVFMFGYVYEFNPDYGLIVPNMLLAPAVIVLSLVAGYYAIRHLSRDTSARFLVLWIASYLVFNILWNAGDDIFWIQIIPPTWLIVLKSQGIMTNVSPASRNEGFSLGHRNWRWYAFIALVSMLFIVNTRAIVLPVSGSGFLLKQAQHEKLLRSGDLEIIPGWDEQKWMMLSNGAPSVQRIALMNAALEPEGSPKHIKKLDDIVASHLRRGGRVIVARLYDLDQDLLPWYSLKKLGWPRKIIQGLLASYCNRPLAEINGVKFRELYLCPTTKTLAIPGIDAPRNSNVKNK